MATMVLEEIEKVAIAPGIVDWMVIEAILDTIIKGLENKTIEGLCSPLRTTKFCLEQAAMKTVHPFQTIDALAMNKWLLNMKIWTLYYVMIQARVDYLSN